MCSVLEAFHCFRHSLKEHYQLFQILKYTNSLLNIVFLKNCLIFFNFFFYYVFFGFFFGSGWGNGCVGKILATFFRAAILRKEGLFAHCARVQGVSGQHSQSWFSSRQPCEEQGGELEDPSGFLPAWDALWWCISMCVLAGNRCSLSSAWRLHWQWRWKIKIKILSWIFKLGIEGKCFIFRLFADISNSKNWVFWILKTIGSAPLKKAKFNVMHFKWFSFVFKIMLLFYVFEYWNCF